MKKIFALTLLICMILCLGACSGNTETSEASSEIANETSPEDFECEDISGGLSIVGYTGNASSVKIPSVINNKKVISVEATAFSGNVSIEEIYLPDTLEDKFDLKVFESCDSLKKICFAGYIEKFYSHELSIDTIIFESLSSSAFGNINNLISKCENLTKVVINNVVDFEYDYFTKSQLVENRTVDITIPANVSVALSEGISYEYVDFWENWEQNVKKYNLRNAFDDEKLVASDVCSSKLKEAFEEADIELTSDISFWKKLKIEPSEYPSIVAISSAKFDGEEHIVEFELSDIGDEEVLDIEESQGFYIYPSSLIYAKQLSAPANFCIAFGCKNVIVNGAQYSF